MFAKTETQQEFPAFILIPQVKTTDFWAKAIIKQNKSGKRVYSFRKDIGIPTPGARSTIELLSQLVNSGKIDPKRIYLGGLSMGAMGTLEILHRMPNTFAAAFPICGGSHPDLCENYAQNTAVWLFHGAKDDVIPAQHSRRIYKKLGADVRYTEYPNLKHNSWDAAFAEPDLLPWLFSKTLK